MSPHFNALIGPARYISAAIDFYPDPLRRLRSDYVQAREDEKL